MKTLLTITMIIALAIGAMGATKADLKTRLIDSEKYLSVNDAVRVDGQKYKYVVTIATDDSLVVNVGTVYAWVLNHGQVDESAYFLKTNPTATIVTDFYTLVRNYMDTNGVDGMIQNVTVVGDIESAIVMRYIAGSDANHTIEQRVRVTRTNGTTWAVKIIE